MDQGDLYFDEKPDLAPKSIVNYFANRIPTLKPPPFHEKKHLINPFPPLRQITGRQWLFIISGMLFWTLDAIDYFAVPITQTLLAESFDKKPSDISWAVTLVLMLRSVGAVIFGIAGDKWGRKWPLIINTVLFIIVEIGTGFCQTFKQFLGVRAVFGVAMGGIYGNASAMALEDCPVEARGFISGLFQECYALGYLFVVIFNRAITPTTPHGWRSLFWLTAGLGVIPIVVRLALPETETFKKQKQEDTHEDLSKSFVNQGKECMKTHWLMFIYLILLMVGMNFSSHGSQDLFTTYVEDQRGFSIDATTVANCVANLGALAGGIFMGHASEFLGRRLTIMIACVLGGALIYPWGFSKTTSGINASVFFMQFMVQGAWGVIPIHISELSHPRFRSFIVGTSYQLGNLGSSAASTIESKIGERFPLTDGDGNPVEGKYDYGRVMAILMGAVFAYLLVITFLGPERRGANLTSHDPNDFEDGAIKRVSYAHDEYAEDEQRENKQAS